MSTEKYYRFKGNERRARVALAQSPEGRGFDFLSQGAGHRERVRQWGRTGFQSKCQLSLDSYIMFLLCEVWINVLLSSCSGGDEMSGNGGSH